MVAATTNRDLAEDLTPDVLVHKRFGKKVTVDYFPDAAVKECSLLQEMDVAEGRYEDWKSVAQFHNRSHRISFMDRVFVLRRGSYGMSKVDTVLKECSQCKQEVVISYECPSCKLRICMLCAIENKELPQMHQETRLREPLQWLGSTLES